MLRRSPYSREVYVVKPPTGMRFSSIELQQIAVSILVLTLAFTILFSKPFSGAVDAQDVGFYFLVSLVAVVTAFLFHELAHKFLAQKYGCWAEYRWYPFGLLFALVLSTVGFVFAAPGAVHISGYLTKDQSGKISAVGPLTNAIVGGVFLALAFLLVLLGSDWFLITWLIAYINIFLAGFNMIPFPPLDGSKVLHWDKVKFAMIAILILTLLAITFSFDTILVILGF